MIQQINQKWNSNGDLVFEEVIVLTIDEVAAECEKIVADRLDQFARTRQYENIAIACSYTNSNIIKFKIEGDYCVKIRDATWNKLYEVINNIKNGTRPVPESFSDILDELPALQWPDGNSVSVPQIVTRLQAMVVLHNAGLLNQINQIIAQSDTLTKLAWSEANTFQRDSALLNNLAQQLGLSSNDIDNLFIESAKINV